MRDFKILIVGMIAIFFASCGTTRMLTSNISSKQIDTMYVFKPITSISIIHKGNRGVYDTMMSNLSEKHLNDKINTYFPTTMTLKPAIFDPMIQKKIDRDILNLINYTERQQSIVNVPIPLFLDSVMEINQFNYGLLVYQNGFTRTRSNYAGQIATGVLIGILSMGRVYTVPNKANSQLICCIIDRRHKNIAFYRKNIKQDSEPVDINVTNKQIKQVFQKYFYPDSN